MKKAKIIHWVLVVLIVVVVIALYLENRHKFWKYSEQKNKVSKNMSKHNIHKSNVHRMTKVQNLGVINGDEKDLLLELDTIRKRMDIWFDKMQENVIQDKEGFVRRFNPKIELQETEDKYYIRCELPGVDKTQIEISVQGQYLFIRGKKESLKREKEESMYYSEFKSGYFQRRIMLPDNSDINNIKAEYDNGVLVIGVPKLQEFEKPKSEKIQVI